MGETPPKRAGGPFLEVARGWADRRIEQVEQEGARAPRAAVDSGPEAGHLNPSCIGVPAETELRIDDFEDGNNAVRAAPGRQGFWSISHDDTPGMVVPDVMFVPSVGGANGTDYAAHFVASGFTEWGVNIFANMQRLVGGVHCPFSAVGTRGFGLWLKGKGRVRIGASTAGVYSIEFGGTCNPDTESCWDNHTKLVPLPTEWTYREILWGSLEQSGWGKKVPFDVGALIDIRFALLPEDLPGEFWIDEITLLPSSDGGNEAGPLDAAPELDATPDSAGLIDAAPDPRSRRRSTGFRESRRRGSDR